MSLAILEFSNRRHRQQLVVRSTDEIGAARVAVKAVLTTKKRSTGISVCRDLLHTFQHEKYVIERQQKNKRQQIKGKTNQGITVLFT